MVRGDVRVRARAPAPAALRPAIQRGRALRRHYFEDGNVQLQTHKAYDDRSLDFADAAGLAAAAVDAIDTCETDLQKGLQDMYDNMSNETFKAMRRIMPITRTKMKWNIHEISLNRNLRK